MAANLRCVFLIRHGRTPLNAEGRIRGLANPELDEVGKQQALATARALSAEGICHVASSPLRRAAVTADIIAGEVGADRAVDDAFNDRDYGPWTGHLKAEVVERWGSVDDAPGVEASTAVLTRARTALQGLADSPALGSLAVVTHDAVIRPLLAWIEPGVHAQVETASWSELHYDGGAWAIASLDNSPA